PGDAALGGFPLGIEIHIAGRSGGGCLAIAECLGRAVMEANHHESAATEVSCLGVDHSEGESHCNGRIDGAATLPENVPADRARDRASRDHHCAVCFTDL